MNNSPTSQDFAPNGDLIGHISDATHFVTSGNFDTYCGSHTATSGELFTTGPVWPVI